MNEKINRAALVRVISAAAALITILAGLITIFGFVTGYLSLSTLFPGHTALPAPSSATSQGSAPTTPSPSAATVTVVPSVNLIYSNSLLSPSSGWQTDQYCSFESDGYHVKQSICGSPLRAQGNFELSVRVKQIAGTSSTGYGIDFRGNCTQTPCQGAYTFSITSGGSWLFTKCSPDCNVFMHQSSSAILTGLNTWNTIDVRAIGHHFQFYVNGTEVGETDDDAFQSGYISLDAGITPECAFTFLSVSSV